MFFLANWFKHTHSCTQRKWKWAMVYHITIQTSGEIKGWENISIKLVLLYKLYRVFCIIHSDCMHNITKACNAGFFLFFVVAPHRPTHIWSNTMWEYKHTPDQYNSALQPPSSQKVFSSIVLHSLLVTTCFCICSKQRLTVCHQSEGYRFHFAPLGGINLNGALSDDGLQLCGRGWIIFLHCRSSRGLVGTGTKKKKRAENTGTMPCSH